MKHGPDVVIQLFRGTDNYRGIAEIQSVGMDIRQCIHDVEPVIGEAMSSGLVYLAAGIGKGFRKGFQAGTPEMG